MSFVIEESAPVQEEIVAETQDQAEDEIEEPDQKTAENTTLSNQDQAPENNATDAVPEQKEVDEI